MVYLLITFTYQLNITAMTTVEQKRSELAGVNTSLNRIAKTTTRQIRKMNDVSRKMMLANLNDLQARKIALLDEIIACR